MLEDYTDATPFSVCMRCVFIQKGGLFCVTSFVCLKLKGILHRHKQRHTKKEKEHKKCVTHTKKHT